MTDDPATWTHCPRCGSLIDPDELPYPFCTACGWPDYDDEEEEDDDVEPG